MSDSFSPILERVSGGEMLDAPTSTRAFDEIMAGRVSEEQLAQFLTVLAQRKPTIAEITGAARSMRAQMTTITASAYAIDLCGTGGDAHGTLNISTACAFVVAGAGVPVAKHGNRNMSSKSGAADVLEALGARIELSPEQASACLRDTGICFLFAQTYHPAMRHAAAVRKQLGFRTIFNLLGPLSNPARVKRQLVGVYAKEWIEPLALVLRDLGTDKAWVVHGGDGMDELTTTDISYVAVLEAGKVSLREISPRELGLHRATLSSLKGGLADANAAAIKRLFEGEHGAYRDIVILNSAAALVVAGYANDLKTGAAMAAGALDKGLAKRTLEKFVAASQNAA
jgi:anthranilate phosphoribosyltransferase